MLNSFLKYFKYIGVMFPLFFVIKNWWDMLFVALFKGEVKTIVYDKYRFRVKHINDLLTIKEIFIDDDYGILKICPKTVIDIGANIGTFSLLCQKNKSVKRIYSYEPDPRTFDMLSENIRLNQSSKIKVFRLAVGSKSGKGTFYSNVASGLSSFFKSRKNTQKCTVNTITLSKIFRDNDLKSVDYLKMDCEGSEYEIFRSSPNSLLKKVKRYGIEYHDSLTDRNHDELISRLVSLGFKVSICSHPIEQNIGIIYAEK